DLNEEVLPELYIIPENAKTKIRTYGQTKEASKNTLIGACNSDYVKLIDKESKESDFEDGEYGILCRNKELSKNLSAHLHIHQNTLKRALIKIQLYEISGGKPIK